MAKKPWEHAKESGSEGDPLAARFVCSLDHDRRLYKHDIRGSRAHAEMLRQVGLIDADDLELIKVGLKSIEDEIDDLGDDWQHTVMLEKMTPLPSGRRAPRPRCIGGARACPPEDCGGPPGYAALLQALRDPKHPEHVSYREWVGSAFDPEAF